MNTIAFNKNLSNYIVLFADGTELVCHNRATAEFYARNYTTSPE